MENKATITICTPTGKEFMLEMSPSDTISAVLKEISTRLKIPQRHLSIQHNESQLQTGTTLKENGIRHGSKLTIATRMQTGLIQRDDVSVMNALESLSDAQVNDFLSGKSPLNLTLRLGDHMMFIQLQLSTLAPSAASALAASTPSRKPGVSPSTLAVASTSSATTQDTAKPVLDTRALAEASRNLTHTLRQLSSAALSSRGEESEDSVSVRRRQGAIIESMHHHGRGVYSGTFSGTLNPALQDCHGRPRRDISTIIHILNDLLGATPHYRRHNRTSAAAATTGNCTHTKPSTDRSVMPKSQEECQRLNQENRATRGKMEQLQLMLEERRARRRARREARAPYSWQGGYGAGQTTAVVRECDSTSTGDNNSASATEFHPLNPPETVVA